MTRAAAIAAMCVLGAAYAAVAVFALGVPASSAARPCVALDLTLQTYAGAIIIDGACVDTLSLTNAALHVVAHDTGDGIFRNGFESLE